MSQDLTGGIGIFGAVAYNILFYNILTQTVGRSRERERESTHVPDIPTDKNQQQKIFTGTNLAR